MARTIKINHSFICLRCGYQVPVAAKTCRNHCTQCLWSQHVDDRIPGDRQSDCHGLMEPKHIEHNGQQAIIVHVCTICQQVRRNKTLADDCWDTIIEITQSGSGL